MVGAFQRSVSVLGLLRNVLAAVVVSFLASMGAQGLTEEQVFEPRLMAMLPPYCKYTQIFRDRVPGGNNPEEIQRWTTLMGPTFIHMHHYCLGLMNTYRAAIVARTKQDRVHNLSNSILEFNYVIHNAPADFSMLPEILTRKGESLILLDRGAEGVAELQGAIERDPDYWPPYATISDYYRDLGQIAKARDWLQKGLAAAPNSKALLRRQTVLDGMGGKSKNVAAQRKPAAARPSD